MAAGVRGEEADEIAIGVTQQQRPVTPGQRGGLGDEAPDEPGLVLMHAVHVIDEELDDHGVVAGRVGGAGWAAPGANSGTARVLPIARVARVAWISAVDPVACTPVAFS